MKYKKYLFIIITIILSINTLLFSFIPVNAVLKVEDLNSSTSNAGEVESKMGSVLTVVSVIGSIISVIILIVIGIKYMLGSVEEKAEYKKTLMPYVIGAFLVFGASSVAGIVYSIFNK